MTSLLFIIDTCTSSHSEFSNSVEFTKTIYFDTQVWGGGQDKLALTACPPPPTPATKHAEQCDKENSYV